MDFPFVCPFCHHALVAESGAMRCSPCDRSYPLCAEIPDFATRTHYWNQITEDQMAALLASARQDGYRHAIENILGPLLDNAHIGYVLGDTRADFRAILPITPQSDVLDLGGGWGAVTCTLAPGCRSVTTVDTNRHTLEFLKIRCEQSHLDNVCPVHIDPLDDARLPFADASFDVAIMNGVLEWVGEASEKLSPREVQRRCLEEVRRVLKPGGTLYVGIENRIAYNYFLGEPDHSHLRYTSLMPRWVASMVTRMRQGRPYRTYTYSYQGYRALLCAAGFQSPDLYLAIPSYRDPEYILPAENNQALAYFMRRRASHIVSKARRRVIETLFNHVPIALSCRLVRQFFYSYLMVAEVRA